MYLVGAYNGYGFSRGIMAMGMDLVGTYNGYLFSIGYVFSRGIQWVCI